MALFGSKKNTKKEEGAPKAPKAKKPQADKSAAVASVTREVSHVLKNPRITEKASVLSEMSNVYVFDVAVRASKKDVMDAVRHFYKAEPVKVNMVAIPSKNVFIRGKKGVKSGGKKAYVFLKKGETIEII